MVIRLGVKELRDNLPATIRRVREGDTVEVTHHGVPVAAITPLPTAGRLAQLVASGQLTPGGRPDFPERRMKSTTGITAGEALAEDRAER